MLRAEKKLSFLGAWHLALDRVLFLQSRSEVECCGSLPSCAFKDQKETGPRPSNETAIIQFCCIRRIVDCTVLAAC